MQIPTVIPKLKLWHYDHMVMIIQEQQFIVLSKNSLQIGYGVIENIVHFNANV